MVTKCERMDDSSKIDEDITYATIQKFEKEDE